MTLDDYIDNSSDSGNSKEYRRITKEEFEECISNISEDYKIINENNRPLEVKKTFTSEYVYAIPLNTPKSLEIRIFSTIDKSTDVVRDKGQDAIRCIVWDYSRDTPVGGKKKTLRIDTFCKNLTDKVEDLLNNWDEYTTECDECGAWMVRREGKYGTFLGCTEYPDCQNTKQIE